MVASGHARLLRSALFEPGALRSCIFAGGSQSACIFRWPALGIAKRVHLRPGLVGLSATTETLLVPLTCEVGDRLSCLAGSGDDVIRRWQMLDSKGRGSIDMRSAGASVVPVLGG